MDAIAGLGLVGNHIANNNEKPRNKPNNKNVGRNKINGDNIYNASNTQKNRQKINSIANKRYRQSQYPLETGIVPNYHNQIKAVQRDKSEAVARGRERERLEKESIEGFSDIDSVFSDEDSIGSRRSQKSNNSLDMGDHMAFFKKGNLIQNNQKYEEKIKRPEGGSGEPGFFSQFEQLAFDNPSDPVSSNNIPHKTGKFASINRLENERKLALDGGYSDFNNEDMTYGVVDKQNLIHNNMVPFFSKGTGKGYGPDSLYQEKLDEVKQRKFETFSGTVKDVGYRPKTERRPLFNPHVGLTHIYGMPNFTNYFETRYIPGRERRNEKLMQPVRITPGLNKGYNEISKQGFHDTFRALPKTVDELRTANNPKISYGKPIIHGKKSDRRPIIPNMAKRAPVTFKENDPRDFVKSLGYYRAPTIYGNYDAPNTNRQMTTRAWYSAANTDGTFHKPESMYGQFKISHKENFHSDTPRNITGVDKKKNTSNTGNSYYLHPTKRQLTEKNTYVQPAGPEYQKEVAFDMTSNIPDPTMRDLTQKRTWNNPAGPEYQKGHAFDMTSNIPDPTMRDLTQKRTWNNPAGPEYQKGHAFDMTSNIPDPTLRNLTEKKTWNNPATLHQAQKGGYQAEQAGTIAPSTLRQNTQKKTWNNPANYHQGQKGGYHVQQVGTIAPTTFRQLTQKNTYYNPIAQHEGQKGGYHVQQAGTIAPTTFRQLTQNKTYYNPITQHEGQKGGYHAEQSGTIAPTTFRQLTQKKTWNNPATHHEGQKGGYQAEQTGTIAPPTFRQLTQNKTYYNPVAQHEGQKGGYHAEQSGTIAPTTLRQSTQNKTWNNPAAHHESQRGGYHVEQGGTIAPTTMRQLTQNKTYQGPLVHHGKEVGGYQAEQEGTVAPTTLRQLTQNKTQLNPASHHEGHKGGYHAEQSGTVAPPTIRQMTQVNTYQGPTILHEGGKSRARADANNTLISKSKEQAVQVRDGGAPTTSNYEKGPSYDYTMVQMCEPIQIKRDLYGNMSGQRPLQCVPTMHTRVPNVLPQQSQRFDTCVVDNLKSNPFINNVVHRSVEY